MFQLKYAILVVLVSIAVISTSADDVSGLTPCSTVRCGGEKPKCVVFTKDCFGGLTPCAKCMNCPLMKCQAGCEMADQENACPSCKCKET